MSQEFMVHKVRTVKHLTLFVCFVIKNFEYLCLNVFLRVTCNVFL